MSSCVNVCYQVVLRLSAYNHLSVVVKEVHLSANHITASQRQYLYTMSANSLVYISYKSDLIKDTEVHFPCSISFSLLSLMLPGKNYDNLLQFSKVIRRNIVVSFIQRWYLKTLFLMTSQFHQHYVVT